MPHRLPRPLVYYITDRQQFSGEDSARRRQLLAKISEAAAGGIDFIQLREKDLSTRDLEKLSREALEAIAHEAGSRPIPPRLLINSRSDVALAVGADGVHLRSPDISVRDVRALYESFAIDPNRLNPTFSGETQASQSALAASVVARSTPDCIVAVSCHSEDEVQRAGEEGADFVVFGPVFEAKFGRSASGVDELARACRHSVPVLALGGVALSNIQSCLEAGAWGIAGIRLFQENQILAIMRRVRGQPDPIL
ncbi:MAG: thiamine phosphate synthase [Acidobacteria bacterium]|nr:thiamine phosphate synthase [Acidobacteriota bacterium]MBV9482026.1 thiamine phosphate synthase [Acidobacteriota bacterium]